jgi:hypothetical protein
MEKRKYSSRKRPVSTLAVIKTIRKRNRHKYDRSARSLVTALNRETVRLVLKYV